MKTYRTSFFPAILSSFFTFSFKIYPLTTTPKPTLFFTLIVTLTTRPFKTSCIWHTARERTEPLNPLTLSICDTAAVDRLSPSREIIGLTVLHSVTPWNNDKWYIFLFYPFFLHTLIYWLSHDRPTNLMSLTKPQKTTLKWQNEYLNPR